MDDRLEKALDIAKTRQTQNIEKRRLQEKLRTDLTIPYGGSNFYIDRDLILYFNTVTEKSVIVLDDNLTPVKIAKVEEFKKLINDTYTTVLAQYYTDFEKLRKKRNIKDIVEL
jgi:hypothetical protein